MRRFIRLPWIVLALSTMIAITLMITTIGFSGEETKAPASPKIIALKFHADWCGFCKAMGPIFTDLQNKSDGKPVLFHAGFDEPNHPSSGRVACLGTGSG